MVHKIITIGLILIGLIFCGYIFLGTSKVGAPSVLSVLQGGTGTNTFTSGECLVGAGTGAITTAVCGAGGGETNTASNLDVSNFVLYDSKSGVDLRFNTLAAGTNITLASSTPNVITISSTGSADFGKTWELYPSITYTDNTTYLAPTTTITTLFNSGFVSQASSTVNGILDVNSLTEVCLAVYNSGETPGGSLGGTWASPTIDDLFIKLGGDSATGDYLFSGGYMEIGGALSASSTAIFNELSIFSGGLISASSTISGDFYITGTGAIATSSPTTGFSVGATTTVNELIVDYPGWTGSTTITVGSVGHPACLKLMGEDGNWWYLSATSTGGNDGFALSPISCE